MLGAQRRRRGGTLPTCSAADEAERFQPAALGLVRCSLVLAFQSTESEALSRAAQLCHTLSWPERELRWYPRSHVASSCYNGLLLHCSLLLRHGGDEPGAEHALERRAAALFSTPAHVVATFALPLPPPFPVLPPLPGAAPLPSLLAFLRSQGFAELQPSLGAEELTWLHRLGLERASIASTALHQRSFTPFEDDFAFADAAARGKGRIELRLPLPSVPAHASSDAARLLALASEGPWARVARAALRDPAPHVTASVIVSRPGAPHQAWHADGPHPERDAARLRYAAWSAADLAADVHRRPAPSPPTALCVFIPLRSLTAQLGGTQLWPGSHALGSGAVEVAAAGAIDLLGGAQTPLPQAGGAMIYDYRLVHRGEANTWQPGDGGSDGVRPLLQFVFHGRAEGGWAEGHNFLGGEALLPARPGETLDAVALAAGEVAAAEGAAWWADAYEELAEPLPPPAAAAAFPSAAGWDVFA